MKKSVPYILLIVLVIIALLLKRGCTHSFVSNNDRAVKKELKRAGAVNRDRGFDRRLSYIEYTEHALCRMDCRKISKRDIQDIMRDGEINYSKSNVRADPCPVYAVQGYTDDGQHLRVIFAQCDYKTKVVTCYDLEREFECHCPGDDKK